MITYLYVKTHNKTGLKYLGKTIRKDPHTYPGSGKYWKRHLKKHGKDYSTEIIRECEDLTSARFWGEYYSNLWNVVESEEWANLIPEMGAGGSNKGRESWNKGKPCSEEQKAKISATQKGRENTWCKGKPISEEHKAKISAARKGWISPFKGTSISDELKVRISANRKGKGRGPRRVA
jgi:hypothetical protein